MTWKRLIPHRFDCDHSPCQNRLSCYIAEDDLAIHYARQNGWTVLKDAVFCPEHVHSEAAEPQDT